MLFLLEEPACFSKDEKVTMADFRSKSIGDVNTGDSIWTMSNNGMHMELSEVMMVSHSAPDDRSKYIQQHKVPHIFIPSAALFYTVETVTGHRLSMTGNHYIHVYGLGFLQANRLSTNHSLHVMMCDRTVQLARIRVIKTEYKTGIYNLFTLSGTYLVNGIAASSYINISYFSHQETHDIVAPLRWGYVLSKPLRKLNDLYPIEESVRKWLIKVLKSYFDTLVFLNHARSILSATSIILLTAGSLVVINRIAHKKPFLNGFVADKKDQ